VILPEAGRWRQGRRQSAIGVQGAGTGGTGEEFDKGGLADAVGPDDADALARLEGVGELVEQQRPWSRQGDRAACERAGAAAGLAVGFRV